MGSLVEIENQWTLGDLLDAHEVLDIQEEADEYHRTHPPKG
jgi:hypothetical protein